MRSLPVRTESAFSRKSPDDAGLSREKLDAIVDFCEELGSAALLVLHDGKVVLYPAYHFFMTAHEMALYGLLYMNDGMWNGRPIIPAEWIAESTRLHSMVIPEAGLGYSYLWYVLSEDVGLGRAFLHTGVGIHLLAVFPELKVVVVHRVDTLADDIRFTGDDLSDLFGLLMAALVDLK